MTHRNPRLGEILQHRGRSVFLRTIVDLLILELSFYWRPLQSNLADRALGVDSRLEAALATGCRQWVIHVSRRKGHLSARDVRIAVNLDIWQDCHSWRWHLRDVWTATRADHLRSRIPRHHAIARRQLRFFLVFDVCALV